MKFKKIRAEKLVEGDEFRMYDSPNASVFLLSSGKVLGENLLVCVRSGNLRYKGEVILKTLPAKKYVWRKEGE